MIIYIIYSIVFWIAAVVIFFLNGLGYCKVQPKYYRNIFGQIKAKKNWRDRLCGFCVFGLPIIFVLIGVWIF